MADGYEFWRAAVAGENPAADINEPQCGFWLRRFKTNPPHVIAIWPRNGELVAFGVDREGQFYDVGEKIMEWWPYVAKWPVREDQFKYYQEHHRLPEEVEILPPVERDLREGHNQPPVHELLADQIHSAAQEALREIAGGIKDQLQADRAANHRDRLLGLEKQAEEMKRKEKQPHREALDEIEGRWKPAITTATNAITFIRTALTPFLKAAKEAAEAAAPAGTEVKAKAGTGKRRTGLRTKVTAKVVDYNAAALALLAMGNQDLETLIERLATRVIIAGGTLAGCERVEEVKAQ